MVVGRYGAIIPTLALAGAFAAKARNDSPTRGTLRTDSAVFTTLLVLTIAIVGALTFLPADALGPIVEHIVMLEGRTF